MKASSPVIIPTPKVVRFSANAKAFRLTRATKIVVKERLPVVQRTVNLLQSAIKSRLGVSLKVVSAGSNPAPANSIVLQLNSGRTKSPGLTKPEGYRLQVLADRVELSGSDTAGLFWGAQTLIQLFQAQTGAVMVPAIVVDDYPSLGIRGVHLFHGQNALPFHQKLISKIYSPFKLNTLVIQAEQLRWDTDPEVAPGWGGSKEAVRQEIAFARAHGIQMIPLVQSYGHMEWMLRLPKNAKYAEDPFYGSDPEYQKDPDFIKEKERRGSYGTIPYSLNYTNPEAVRYMTRFNAEADTLFGAKAFHIGFDEVTHKGRGRFPYKSRPKTFPELYVSAVKYWHNYFKARGKEVWMWADMAMHPTEVTPSFGTAPTPEDAKKVRQGLPKEVVMVDWQYGKHDRFPSLPLLKKAGFSKLIAASWFEAVNIQNLSRAAAEVKALGCLQTTWAGYESKESVLEGPQRKQFVAMVLAAEYFWNGGKGPTPDKLPYNPDEVFRKHYGK